MGFAFGFIVGLVISNWSAAMIWVRIEKKRKQVESQVELMRDYTAQIQKSNKEILEWIEESEASAGGANGDESSASNRHIE